jgi:HPt (histidine-containing phosphotransfer) domain-containing protein
MENLRRVLTQIEPVGSTSATRPEAIANEADPLDRDVLRGLRELRDANEPDFLTELIDLFTEDSEKLMQELRAACLAGDAEEIRQAAHTLKGSSGSLGALRLSKMYHEVEVLGRTKQIENLAGLMPRLEEEYMLAREFLLRERVTTDTK